MSLDGFIAGQDDAMDWVFSYIPLDSPETCAMLEETVRITGSVLSGRRSHNVGRKPDRFPLPPLGFKISFCARVFL